MTRLLLNRLAHALDQRALVVGQRRIGATQRRADDSPDDAACGVVDGLRRVADHDLGETKIRQPRDLGLDRDGERLVGGVILDGPRRAGQQFVAGPVVLSAGWIAHLHLLRPSADAVVVAMEGY
jgi:hypothetical protein